PSRPFLLQPVANNAHVLTTCDLDTQQPADNCSRVAFHASGQRVTVDVPAKRGETITVYAYGLGPTSPAAGSGKPAPVGAEVKQSGALRVWTSVRNQPLNANPSAPRFFDAAAMTDLNPTLQFAGLAPGYVGLYQLNIQVPQSFDVILPCG